VACAIVILTNQPTNQPGAEGSCVSANLVIEFLAFVEGQSRQSLSELLGRILMKSRLLTRAEAGTIFVVRKQGRERWLEPAEVQNDAIKVKRRDFVVPIDTGTIAGYVAHTGRVLRIDDVYAIPARQPYRFDPSREHHAYKTRSMLCFPLKNHEDEVIGVVQLINCRPRNRKHPAPFDKAAEGLVAPIARVVGASIERAMMVDEIRAKNAKLRDRNRELNQQRTQIAGLQAATEDAFQLSIRLLARAAEIHDEETGNHIVRVNEYSYFLARELAMPQAWCDELRYSAQLHDVGKMSVDSAVLKKRGALDAEEREEMDRHTVYGHRILAESPRLQMGAEIALFHHEKWNGSGYPNRVAGDAIPLSARIVQVADVYDALRSQRPYKPAFSHEKTLAIMTRGDERIDPQAHFDPKLVELFARRHAAIAEIWDALQD
jgi:HD-GYP domain-containing protein (c-di-GMP phosphodiesterase class II)